METVKKPEIDYVSPTLQCVDICVEGVICVSGDTTAEEWDIVDLS